MSKKWALVLPVASVLVFGLGFWAGGRYGGYYLAPAERVPSSPSPSPVPSPEPDKNVDSLPGVVVSYDGQAVVVKLDSGKTVRGLVADFGVWSLEASPEAKPRQADGSVVAAGKKVMAAVDKTTGEMVGLLVYEN